MEIWPAIFSLRRDSSVLTVSTCARHALNSSVETNFAPLFEVEDKKFRLSVTVKNPKRVEEYVRRFKKFKHLTDEEIAALQTLTDEKYERLVSLCQMQNR